MNRRQAEKLRPGSKVRLRTSGKVYEVKRVIGTHFDPHAAVPLFELKGDYRGLVTYKLLDRVS